MLLLCLFYIETLETYEMFSTVQVKKTFFDTFLFAIQKKIVTLQSNVQKSVTTMKSTIVIYEHENQLGKACAKHVIFISSNNNKRISL